MSTDPEDEEVSELHSRYAARIASEIQNHPEFSVQNVPGLLKDLDRLCGPITDVDIPLEREMKIGQIRAALIGASGDDTRMKLGVELYVEFIRERVAIALKREKPGASEHEPRVARQSETPASNESLAPESGGLAELRELFVARIIEAPHPSQFQSREQIRAFLITLNRTCDYIVKTPRHRLELMRAVEAMLQYPVQVDPSAEEFVGLVTSYLRENVLVRLTNEPAFSVDAPRIVLQSLIIPGDKTSEGTLVKGVSEIWFEIMRLIKLILR